MEKQPLALRSMRSQLSFMLTENDSLRRDVQTLNRSLHSSQAALLDLSTNNSSLTFAEGLFQEIQSLRDELALCKEERDTALREVLLLKQVSLFYKERDLGEQRAVQN